MKWLINIITITKDDLEGVATTIKSTNNIRTFPGIKQIIIDSSTNATKTAVKTLADSSDNVEYFWQKPSGISAAFNMGLSLAESEWVWFLNGGDEVHVDVQAEIIIYIIQKSSADAIVFQLQRMNSGKMSRHPPMWSLWPPLKSWIPHPATITRSQLYRDFGKFNESFEIAMDYEFWLRCFSKRVVVDMLSLPLVRFDTNGMSNTDKSKVCEEAARIIKMHFWLIMKLWLYNGLGIMLTWKKFISGSLK